MLFNSVAFLVFFPVVCALYFALPARGARISLLLGASCLFYMAFVPAYILILAFTIVIDYLAGLLIARATRHRRLFLGASLVANVGVLAAFKYYPFIAANVDALLGRLGSGQHLPELTWALPIGLSFHTFQAMSYTIEVYRGHQPPERNFIVYALYVMFFPQLVAGPIERPQNLLSQFRLDHPFDEDEVAAGLRRMAWGMFKKVVVADRVAAYADAVYGNPHGYHGLALIVGTVMFAFQIYLDFSAYSDIALGSARVLGIRLMENFDRPYLSRSVGEFWRRWHISLSTWFKDYLYVPLGGSRGPPLVTVRNLLLVFLVSGLWHGANWTFLLWGALHGVFLVIGRFTARWRDLAWARYAPGFSGVRRTLALVSTFSLVSFAWIFFRARTIGEAFYVAGHLFSGLGGDLVDLTRGGSGGLPAVGIAPRAVLLALVLLVERYAGRWVEIDALVRRRSTMVRYALYLGVVYGSILGAGEGTAQQFIYFQF